MEIIAAICFRCGSRLPHERRQRERAMARRMWSRNKLIYRKDALPGYLRGPPAKRRP
jgi:hypothetical protein